MTKPISKLAKKISHMCEIRIIRFEGRIANDGITLRLCRLKDLPVLHSLFGREIFIAASGVKNKLLSSSFSFWRWMSSTFQMMYVMEASIEGDYRVIGLIGLYKIRIGESLWLSAVVFNPQDRGRGYGQTAVRLLLNSLQKKDMVQVVYGEVFKTNVASLELCKRLGFEICGQNKNKFFMKKRQRSSYSLHYMP
jgi:RimJ/RimL family protein N-acetyltransferase